MDDDFDVADAAASDLAHHLVTVGIDPGAVADAFAASAIALFATHHNAPLTARNMLAEWASIREAS